MRIVAVSLRSGKGMSAYHIEVSGLQ